MDPVVAGPLNITRDLIDLNAPLFGLSWGFDLIEADERKDDLSWLADLAGLIVDSKNTRDIALQAGLDHTRIHTIPWGVDLQVFTPEGPRTDLATLGIPHDRVVVLSLRAHEHIYRIGDIITGFALTATEFPDAHLVVGNDGSLRPELERLTESLRLESKVTFIGKRPEHELAQILRAADVYVTASGVDGSSVTLLQAMACGTTVVASDTPGNREWIDPDVTGYLFPLGNPTGLATTLQMMLSDLGSQESKAMRTSARQRVLRTADWHHNSAQLARILLPEH
jgi:glycosyltransferase involved in cell wall biosynthesis